jgi:hypothetical protein
MEEPARFKIKDEHKKQWGKLVKAWAKGEKEHPKNLTELKSQCADFGVVPTIPDFITGLVFVQNDKHVLTVRLPPKELLVAGEQWVATTEGAYPLPSFYDEFFVAAQPRTDMTSNERLDFHGARVGEYSVNSCA